MRSACVVLALLFFWWLALPQAVEAYGDVVILTALGLPVLVGAVIDLFKDIWKWKSAFFASTGANSGGDESQLRTREPADVSTQPIELAPVAASP